MNYNQTRVVRVDESYYHPTSSIKEESTKISQSPRTDYSKSQDIAHSQLIDAINATLEPPCTKFNCERIEQCALEKVDCRLFRHYANNNNYSTRPEKYIARLFRPYDQEETNAKTYE